jgi:predicted enzyme related to lactoylglutathione lyase
MSAKTGTIGWVDLTVPDAVTVRDFYTSVLGVETSAVPMGDYEDFCLHPAGGGDAVAGVCHARGPNSDLPAAWMVYFLVADVEKSVAECRARGGVVVREPKRLGEYGTLAVIRDPAGAVCALMQPAAKK